MSTTTPYRTFRAENVGSLLRPDYLKQAREDLKAEKITAAEFKRIEDRAVDEAITLQEECGLEVISDGETRRMTFTGSLTEALGGVEGPPPPPTHWHGDAAYNTEDAVRNAIPFSVSGKLSLDHSVATEEFSYLRARTDKPTKATLPSPLLIGKLWNPETSTSAYSDPFEAIKDATEILKDEIAELVRLGCEYIQIDATDIATLADPAARKQYDDLGVGADRMLGEGIDLLNSLTGIPGITFGLHLCKGNSDGRYIAAGAYDPIAEQVFTRVPGYDVLLLEYDDERSGGFEPLTVTQDHQTVVLGLVSSKIAELETEDEVVARIEEATKFVPLERLAVSCQCGFASTSGGNQISAERQREKLELVSKVARRVWN